jgi:hypothetical protein
MKPSRARLKTRVADCVIHGGAPGSGLVSGQGRGHRWRVQGFSADSSAANRRKYSSITSR